MVRDRARVLHQFYLPAWCDAHAGIAGIQFTGHRGVPGKQTNETILQYRYVALRCRRFSSSNANPNSYPNPNPDPNPNHRISEVYD